MNGPTTRTPATEAGQALASTIDYHSDDEDAPCQWLARLASPCDCGLNDAILAIEQEARANARADFQVIGPDNMAYLAGRADADAQIAAAEERAAHWKGNHKHEIELKRKQHAMIVVLREALEVAAQRLDAEGRGTMTIDAVLSDTAAAATEEVERIEVKAVARALVRMKQLGILVDKVRQPEVTARALLDTEASEGTE